MHVYVYNTCDGNEDVKVGDGREDRDDRHGDERMSLIVLSPHAFASSFAPSSPTLCWAFASSLAPSSLSLCRREGAAELGASQVEVHQRREAAQPDMLYYDMLIYEYIYIYIYTYIHTRIYIYIYIYLYVMLCYVIYK